MTHFQRLKIFRVLYVLFKMSIDKNMNVLIVKKLWLAIFIFSAIIFLSACKDKQSSTELSAASVNPFDTAQLESQALTNEDRLKLASASGKTVAVVMPDKLAQRILQSTDKLYVYCFWNMQNDASVSTVKALQQVSSSYDSTQLKVVFINMMDVEKVEAVNLFIRENQISDEVLFLEKANFSYFSNQIKKSLVDITALPVVLMVNKAEQTFQFYNKPMDVAEWMALMQPLLIHY